MAEFKEAAEPTTTSAGIDETKIVHFISQEGESFDVEIGVAKMSELVKTMLDDEHDGEETQEIPLPNVKSAVLAKVIEFCQYHKVKPMEEIEKVTLFLYFQVYSLINSFDFLI
jgi:hypothetical protein